MARKFIKITAIIFTAALLVSTQPTAFAYGDVATAPVKKSSAFMAAVKSILGRLAAVTAPKPAEPSAVKVGITKPSPAPAASRPAKDAPSLTPNIIWRAMHDVLPIGVNRLRPNLSSVERTRNVGIAIAIDAIAEAGATPFIVSRGIPVVNNTSSSSAHKGLSLFATRAYAGEPGANNGDAADLNAELQKSITALNARLGKGTSVKNAQDAMEKDILTLVKQVKDDMEAHALSAEKLAEYKLEFRRIFIYYVNDIFVGFLNELEDLKKPTPPARVMAILLSALVGDDKLLVRTPSTDGTYKFFETALLEAIDRVGYKPQFKKLVLDMLVEKGLLSQGEQVGLFALLDLPPPIFDEILNQLSKVDKNMTVLEAWVKRELASIEGTGAKLAVLDDKAQKLRPIIRAHLAGLQPLDVVMDEITRLFKKNILDGAWVEVKGVLTDNFGGSPKALNDFMEETRRDVEGSSLNGLKNLATDIAKQVFRDDRRVQDAGTSPIPAWKDNFLQAVMRAEAMKFLVNLLGNIKLGWVFNTSIREILDDTLFAQDAVILSDYVDYDPVGVMGYFDLSAEAVQDMMRQSQAFLKMREAFNAIDKIMRMIPYELEKGRKVMEVIEGKVAEMKELQDRISKKGDAVLAEIERQRKEKRDSKLQNQEAQRRKKADAEEENPPMAYSCGVGGVTPPTGAITCTAPIDGELPVSICAGTPESNPIYFASVGTQSCEEGAREDPCVLAPYGIRGIHELTRCVIVRTSVTPQPHAICNWGTWTNPSAPIGQGGPIIWDQIQGLTKLISVYITGDSSSSSSSAPPSSISQPASPANGTTPTSLKVPTIDNVIHPDNDVQQGVSASPLKEQPSVPATPVKATQPSAATYDFGDARAGFPTLRSENGPRHIVNRRVWLGLLIDGEADGLRSDRDDAVGIDDEDGKVSDNPLTVLVSSTIAGRVYINAWEDWNNDSRWNIDVNGAPGDEWIVRNQSVNVRAYARQRVALSQPRTGPDGLPLPAAWPNPSSQLRITITETPISNGNPAIGQYPSGETEDYLGLAGTPSTSLPPSPQPTQLPVGGGILEK